MSRLLPVSELDEVVRAVGDWEPLRGARLFITGGTGFFGMWLLESLAHANRALDLGLSATVLTRDAAGFHARAPHLQDGVFQWIEGDVRNFPFPDGSFSHVIHGATSTQANLYGDQPKEMLDTIVAGTQRVLDFAMRAGTKRLLFLSSGAVYGAQPSDLTHVPEDYLGAPDILDPGTVYGQGKRMAELLCALHQKQHGLEIPIARGFAFVGPHLPLDAHFAIGNFIGDALAGRPIHIGGDGTPFRSYLYASDLAAWLWTILLQGQGSRAYNVGSDEDLSVLDLARRIAQPRHLEITQAEQVIPGAPPSRYVPSIERAKQELGLRIRVPLDEAIERTLRWHQQH